MSGRITKARKNKYSTPHRKNHRWQSFTDKIAQLHSLDPLRKVRRHDLDAEDLSSTTSYFRTALQKWNDLNISKSFVHFKREILPLSESLPQIVHFQERIMGLLENHISKQEKEALEPLLDLLVAFAHDLGVRFEKYYKRALELVASIAGATQPADVIEWTFAALAFLFKYLSKLLIPDLRPTYDAMAPLLGKKKHPPHIARFAAEAMSFLVKKAAAPSTRETALALIVQHVRTDLLATVGDRQFTLYQDGVMTMFAEAMKGPGETIHSTGPAIFTALLRAVPEEEFSLAPSPTWTNALCGILTSEIHHSNAETLSKLVEGLQEYAEAQIAEFNGKTLSWRLVPLIRTFGVLAGVRSGSRIANWGLFVRTFVDMLSATSKTSLEVTDDQASLVWRYVIFSTAITWQQAPVEALIPNILVFTNVMTKEPFMRWFVPFCAYFSAQNSDRFRSLFLKHFQRSASNSSVFAFANCVE
jgi:U3 small nucleolar RNA-associated protein 20